jgi:SAM-dependent MidA family methyltransferase
MRAEPIRSPLGAPPIDDAGEPRLIELIRAEIEASGPITFARFVERALYEPGLGYYATSEARPTRTGDFLTAPELHPIFGHALARQLDEMWRRLAQPERFVLREYGAGTGALYLAIVDGLTRIRSGLAAHLAYQPIENVARQAAADRPAGPFVGCVLANEFIDALPVHRVVGQEGGGLAELLVGWRDGRFVEVVGGPADARLCAWLARRAVSLPQGRIAEVNLAMLDWLAEIGGDLERGYALILDYGAPAAELYGADHPERASGTLRAFRGQHVSSDVLGAVGHQDLTAHVDLDTLADGARDAGLEVLGRVRQAEFLLGCGLDEAYVAARAEADNDWDSALNLRAAVRRLLDPQALGGYAAVVLGKGVAREPPLIGLRSLR